MKLGRSVVLSGLISFTLVAQQASPPVQQAPQQPAGEPVKFSTSTQLVVEMVTVKDKSGKIVEGLTAKDFVVTEDGKPQTIQFLEFQSLKDEPVLAPEAHYYQRLLALDEDDAHDVAEQFVKEKTVQELYDCVLIPALAGCGSSSGASAEGPPKSCEATVLDTLARAMPGGEENSARDVGRLVYAFDLARRHRPLDGQNAGR